MNNEQQPEQEQQENPYKSLKGLEIQKVYLHQGVDILGCGILTVLATTENNASTKTRGIKMKLIQFGVACEFENRTQKRMEFFIIPHANIIAAFS